MGMLSEFKDFAIKGNMIDMAVGIVIGGAFGTIVKSLVNDVAMPPIGLLLGGVDFSNIKIPLKAASEGVEAVSINIGSFINNCIAFLVVAFAVFMMVKTVNHLKEVAAKKEKEEAAAAPPSDEVVLLTEIRDALKK